MPQPVIMEIIATATAGPNDTLTAIAVGSFMLTGIATAITLFARRDSKASAKAAQMSATEQRVANELAKAAFDFQRELAVGRVEIKCAVSRSNCFNQHLPKIEIINRGANSKSIVSAGISWGGMAVTTFNALQEGTAGAPDPHSNGGALVGACDVSLKSTGGVSAVLPLSVPSYDTLVILMQPEFVRQASQHKAIEHPAQFFVEFASNDRLVTIGDNFDQYLRMCISSLK